MGVQTGFNWLRIRTSCRFINMVMNTMHIISTYIHTHAHTYIYTSEPPVKNDGKHHTRAYQNVPGLSPYLLLLLLLVIVVTFKVVSF